MTPRLIKRPGCKDVLMVLYDAVSLDWNEQIKAARQQHSLTPGKSIIIAVPAGQAMKGWSDHV